MTGKKVKKPKKSQSARSQRTLADHLKTIAAFSSHPELAKEMQDLAERFHGDVEELGKRYGLKLDSKVSFRLAP